MSATTLEDCLGGCAHQEWNMLGEPQQEFAKSPGDQGLIQAQLGLGPRTVAPLSSWRGQRCYWVGTKQDRPCPSGSGWWGRSLSHHSSLLGQPETCEHVCRCRLRGEGPARSEEASGGGDTGRCLGHFLKAAFPSPMGKPSAGGCFQFWEAARWPSRRKWSGAQG